MEIDYWRTRTVEEAMKDYAFLRLTCACGRITDYPFTLLLQRRGVTRDTFIGNIRFRCKKCGVTTKQVAFAISAFRPVLAAGISARRAQ
jgi:hypothetical protein